MFSDELAAVRGYYAARIAAVRGTVSARDIAAVMRVIRNEQIIAVRAVLERWSAAARFDEKAAGRQRRYSDATPGGPAGRVVLKPSEIEAGVILDRRRVRVWRRIEALAEISAGAFAFSP